MKYMDISIYLRDLHFQGATDVMHKKAKRKMYISHALCLLCCKNRRQGYQNHSIIITDEI